MRGKSCAIFFNPDRTEQDGTQPTCDRPYVYVKVSAHNPQCCFAKMNFMLLLQILHHCTYTIMKLALTLISVKLTSFELQEFSGLQDSSSKLASSLPSSVDKSCFWRQNTQSFDFQS